MHEVMRSNDGMFPWDPSIKLGDCLYWIHCRHDGLVVFDTVAESFRLMPGPAATGSYKNSLQDMDGSLGLICLDEKNAAIKLWVLEDAENEAWSFKYQIQLSPPVMSPHSYYTYWVHVLSPHGGDLLVCRANMITTVIRTFRCDGGGKLLEKLRWGPAWRSRVTGHRFKESLVDHDFFPKPSADCVAFQRL
jgi:F-box interacting protein